MKRLSYLALACSVAAVFMFGSPQSALAADQPGVVATTAGAAPVAGRISLANSKNPFEVLSPDSPELLALSILAQDGFIKDNLQALADHKPLTRYQATIIAAEAITNAETMMHDGKTVAAISQKDLQALKQTFASFQADLATLKGRVDTLDTRVSAVEQSATSMHNEMVKLTQTVVGVIPTITKPGFELHGEFRVRPVNSFRQTASGTDIAGAPLPAGASFPRTGVLGDNVSLPIGDNGFGQQEGRLRLVGTGNISDSAKFIIRISTEENGGAANGLGSFIHNDFDFFEYNVPKTPWTFYGGKLLYCCNTPWLANGSGLIADAVPIGMALKWNAPNKRWDAWASAGSLKNAETPPTLIPSPPNNIGLTQNITAGHVGAAIGTSAYAGYQYIGMNSQFVANFVSGAPVTALGPVTAGSLYVSDHFSPQAFAQAEYLLRYGNDPTTRARWDGPGAFLIDFNFGSGAQYTSTGTLRYVNTGKNSVITSLDPIINGVDSIWNAQFLPYATNLRLYELGYSYRFDKNAHLDLNYAHSSLGKSETGFNGSTLTKDDRTLYIVTTGFNF